MREFFLRSRTEGGKEENSKEIKKTFTLCLVLRFVKRVSAFSNGLSFFFFTKKNMKTLNIFFFSTHKLTFELQKKSRAKDIRIKKE